MLYKKPANRDEHGELLLHSLRTSFDVVSMLKPNFSLGLWGLYEPNFYCFRRSSIEKTQQEDDNATEKLTSELKELRFEFNGYT
jgi:hypothetical protein